jgi:hypothetical protein
MHGGWLAGMLMFISSSIISISYSGANNIIVEFQDGNEDVGFGFVVGRIG